MEEGERMETELGAPQGGNLSPILSNVFLHYVLDLWFEKRVKPNLKGYAEYFRFADDCSLLRAARGSKSLWERA